ncbi:glycosyltransferase [Geovibrio thiophilus]|uniref:Glycosyltransferase n=1 Tax=Geovibrio thiophilus TaxID=139438 RepID=A0A3R5XW58_9BACT|nr:glycosyltransferase [Geovibrio thiophilus]QAR32106.1 glycosyltransferase [Geovibrio thiophilus]
MTDKAIAAVQAHTDENLSIGSAEMPLVSVIVTSFNYEKYLRECVDSCLNQDYPLIQLIITDDCSSDGSRRIIEEYSDRAEIVLHHENKGQLAAFFSGLERAKGEFTVFVDADDFLDLDAVSAHIYLHLFRSPPAGFTCLRNRQVSESSAILSSFHPDFIAPEEITYLPPRVIHTPTWSWSTTSAMMFRTDLLRLIKTENTDAFRVCADYYIAHFANLLGGSLLFDRAKVNYRRHGKNLFAKNFIIGGNRPTGSLLHHGHPAHETLQKEIVTKMIEKRAEFEPYFSDEIRYAAAILFAAPFELIENFLPFPPELAELLKSAEPEVMRIRDEQIRLKKAARAMLDEEINARSLEKMKDGLKKRLGI